MRPIRLLAGLPERLPARVFGVPGVDLTLAFVMLPIQLVGVFIVSVPVYVLDTGGGPPSRLEGRDVDWMAWCLLVVAALMLVWRTKRPRVALVVESGILAAYLARGYPVGPIVLPVMMCLYTTAAAGRRRRTALAALAFVVAACGFWVPRIARILDAAATFVGTVTVFYAVVLAIFGGPVLFGEVVRVRREAAEARVAQAMRDAERRVAEERLRIARELHDVVAHSMAGIAVQSAATLRLLGDPDDEVREALTAIRTASRQALGELRSTVGMLRDTGLKDTDGLERLDTLLEAVRKAGVPVELDRSGDEVPLPPETGHAAYRIVQESLTNVLRHAGHGATARVRVVYGDGDLLLEVVDDGPGLADGHGAGHGLSGMRERAESVGGSVVAGTLPGGADGADSAKAGGFRVSARLPLTGVRGEAR
ncbi:sensor histidine kinase [Yinghuangia seranimata]|uniref:sensor histidine kinase n=1 Tax=Yinghuangia seranimata TaxID=408067 RepID=UPI00248D057A|nr:sensor histidine kinase [Yinghuangia seranimata]MDI2127326.1 sensor histidine kinase [Yinghuangia seranimata]